MNKLIYVLPLMACCWQCTSKSSNNTKQQIAQTEVKETIAPTHEQSKAVEVTTVESISDKDEPSAKERFDFTHFEELKTLTISKTVVVKYNPKETKIINKEAGKLPKDHPLYDGEFGFYDMIIMEFKLDVNNSESYLLRHTWGPSNDPSFSVHTASDGKCVGSVHGTQIFIPGNSSVYGQGVENACFNLKQKYAFINNKLEAVSQPYYYAGLKTKTQKTIKLYSDDAMTNVLATIPPKYDVEVLMAAADQKGGASMDKFLIKTSFGLVGWATVKTFGMPDEVDIKELQYLGD